LGCDAATFQLAHRHVLVLSQETSETLHIEETLPVAAKRVLVERSREAREPLTSFGDVVLKLVEPKPAQNLSVLSRRDRVLKRRVLSRSQVPGRLEPNASDRRADAEVDREPDHKLQVGRWLVPGLHPRRHRLLWHKELAGEVVRLHLIGVSRDAADSPLAVDNLAVPESPMPELMGEREPLTRRVISSVDEDERLTALQLQRPCHPVGQLRDGDWRPSRPLNERKDVRKRRIETCSQLLARKSGSCDSSTTLCRHLRRLSGYRTSAAAAK
jgi:hypothetical protein